MGDLESIADLRRQIDEIDASLLTFLASRLQLCLAVGELKERCGMPIMQPSRVKEITEKMAQAAAALGLSTQFASGLWTAIILEACRLEELRKEQSALAAPAALPLGVAQTRCEQRSATAGSEAQPATPAVTGHRGCGAG